MKRKLKYIEVFVLLATVYVLYLICNILTPMVIDDCSYAATGRTVADIIARQSNDYMHWSGRVVAHSVAQFWGGIAGKGLFNWINPFAICLLVWLLAQLADKDRKVRVSLLALSAGLIWFIVPDQYVTQFMIAGSMNYMWASMLVLLFLAAFKRMLEEPAGGWRGIGLVALAWLAGVWSEMYAVCVIPALVIALFVWRRSIKMNGWSWGMLAAYAAGATIVVLAPGNFARMGGLAAEGDHVTGIGTKLVNVIIYVLDSPLPWIWIATVLLWLFNCKNERTFWKESCFDMVAIAVSIGFCVLSGAAWPRTHFPAYLFSFMMLVRVVSGYRMREWVGHVAILLALAVIVIDFCHEQHVLREQLAATQYIERHAAEADVLPWNGKRTSRKSISNNCLSCKTTNWRNIAFADYYGVPSMVVVPSEVYEAETCCEETDNYVLIYPNDSIIQHNLEGLHLVYTTDTLYKYPTKLSRLVAIFGWPLNERYYRSRSEAPFARGLLKVQTGLETELMLPKDDDVAGELGTAMINGRQVLWFPKEKSQMAGYKITKKDYLLR